jgi:ribonuclease Z
MHITMLGTGNAVVTECYNTCFVLSDARQHLLVDAGGGSGIVTQLSRASLSPAALPEIFVTHCHIDHLLGVVWMMRLQSYALARGSLDHVTIYGHDEAINCLTHLRDLLLPREAALAGDRLHLVSVSDGETRQLMGHDVTFFDINSTKAKQFGFCMALDSERRLVCCGDEPLSESAVGYATDADWLLHEAFCLEAEAERFRPHEKHHSTVASACQTAERLGVKNLLLYHTEDTHYATRQQLYREEGQRYFSGNLFVPYDLDTIEL